MKNLLAILFLTLILDVSAQVQTGKASFYGDKFEGNPTASGEKYRHSKLTGAHRSLPFGTRVRVTNLANNESVVVTINDRGPFVEGRIVDLSKSAAEKLRFFNQGIADVKIEIVDPGDGKGDTQPVMVEHVTIDEREIYDFKISRADPKGFGVQLGTYQELANLLRIIDNLTKTYRKRMLVQVKVLNGVKFYSPMLASFPNREKAQSMVVELKKQFPDAFVIDLSSL